MTKRPANLPYGLTRKQRQVLDFVAEAIAMTGVSPSYDEIRIAFGETGKANVHRIVGELIDRGYLACVAGRARSLTVLRGLDELDCCPHCGGPLYEPAPESAEPGRASRRRHRPGAGGTFVTDRLSPVELDNYRHLRRRKGFRQADALRAIGRPDLINGPTRENDHA